MSQLEVSLRAGISQRHVSVIETGRSRPRAEVIHRIAEALQVPLREQNTLLAAAGIAPEYAELSFSAAPIAPLREAIERLLASHEAFPAIVIDRWWDVVASNQAARRLLPLTPDGSCNARDLFLPGAIPASTTKLAHERVVKLRPQLQAFGLPRRSAEHIYSV